ncbi:alpha/beta hydrolase [Sphingobacterium phlebotomi]|nr:alpha/beta hydrolase fold domain-containing protein [Sphingobacterium phlebotomi]
MNKTVYILCVSLLTMLKSYAQNEPIELVYKEVDTVSLAMKLYYPEDYVEGERRPAIILFFGGGWNKGSINQFRMQAKYFASKGMLAVTADYRVRTRHGTTPFECVKDARSAIRYLREHADELGIDTSRIAAGGGSAGGHIAAAADLTFIDEISDNLSVDPRPNALVLFNPVFNNGPDNYGYDRLNERYIEISPFHLIRKGAAPAVVFLGTDDKLIPIKTAKEYQTKMLEVGSRCDLFLYEGQGHGFFNYSPKKNSKYYQQTLDESVKFLLSLGFIKHD